MSSCWIVYFMDIVTGQDMVKKDELIMKKKKKQLNNGQLNFPNRSEIENTFDKDTCSPLKFHISCDFAISVGNIILHEETGHFKLHRQFHLVINRLCSRSSFES